VGMGAAAERRGGNAAMVGVGAGVEGLVFSGEPTVKEENSGERTVEGSVVGVVRPHPGKQGERTRLQIRLRC